jgi:hypothetical protein
MEKPQFSPLSVDLYSIFLPEAPFPPKINALVGEINSTKVNGLLVHCVFHCSCAKMVCDMKNVNRKENIILFIAKLLKKLAK